MANDNLKVSAGDSVEMKEGINLNLIAKKGEVSGDLSKEVAKLREDVQFETRVLYIGFAVIFVAVGIFIIQAFMQWTNSYDTLLNKVDILQAEIGNQATISAPKAP